MTFFVDHKLNNERSFNKFFNSLLLWLFFHKFLFFIISLFFSHFSSISVRLCCLLSIFGLSVVFFQFSCLTFLLSVFSCQFSTLNFLLSVFVIVFSHNFSFRIYSYHTIIFSQFFFLFFFLQFVSHNFMFHAQYSWEATFISFKRFFNLLIIAFEL